jgi:hypothetical protein
MKLLFKSQPKIWSRIEQVERLGVKPSWAFDRRDYGLKQVISLRAGLKCSFPFFGQEENVPHIFTPFTKVKFSFATFLLVSKHFPLG